MNPTSKDILQQVQFAFARPIHPRGVIWVGVALLAAVLSVVMGWNGAPFWLAMTGLFYVCFRDPARVPPQVEGIGIAPADGILTKIDRAPWPVESEQDGDAQRITINPRFYDVHVLRAPVSGAITLAQQISGQWGSPVFDKTASGNERAVFGFKISDGRPIYVEIIGGGAPDRIRFTARTGDVVTLAQPMGYASFGSEVRVYVPENVTVIASVGQRMVAGETPVVALEVN